MRKRMANFWSVRIPVEDMAGGENVFLAGCTLRSHLCVCAVWVCEELRKVVVAGVHKPARSTC
jgi:hypothetical protein